MPFQLFEPGERVGTTGWAGTALHDFLQEAREAVDRALAVWSARVGAEMPGPVGSAIAYSLAAPGKRLRPALVTAVHGELGGHGEVAELAAAVEVIHTYSLVHDDLPCMDDDDLRRGRPTTHRRFGIAVAAEAGFRMVPLAARVLASGAARLGLADPVLGAIGQELFQAAGAAGMIGGQVLDLEAEGRKLEAPGLADIHRKKTGALITASAVVGALAAGASRERVEAVRAFGRDVGFAFQVVDDVLDATGTSEELGKTAGKDARQQKATFATVYGNDEALAQARACARRAVDRRRTTASPSSGGTTRRRSPPRPRRRMVAPRAWRCSKTSSASSTWRARRFSSRRSGRSSRDLRPGPPLPVRRAQRLGGRVSANPSVDHAGTLSGSGDRSGSPRDGDARRRVLRVERASRRHVRGM